MDSIAGQLVATRFVRPTDGSPMCIKYIHGLVHRLTADPASAQATAYYYRSEPRSRALRAMDRAPSRSVSDVPCLARRYLGGIDVTIYL
jgi:hypothetical protein